MLFFTPQSHYMLMWHELEVLGSAFVKKINK
jgi:hypothetical protein